MTLVSDLLDKIEVEYQSLHVVAIGDAFDGIVLWGPFDTFNDALLWAEIYANGEWHIIPLSDPEHD